MPKYIWEFLPKHEAFITIGEVDPVNAWPWLVEGVPSLARRVTPPNVAPIAAPDEVRDERGVFERLARRLRKVAKR